MFLLTSDEINLIYLAESGQEEPLELTNTGIAWESDKKYKFKNPEGDLETGKLLWRAITCSWYVVSSGNSILLPL